MPWERLVMRKFKFNRLERRRIGGTGDEMQLSVPIPKSPSGKVYRYSPNPDAVPRLFLLGDAPTERAVTDMQRARMRLEPGSPRTVCPYSGLIAGDGEFIHFDDVEAVKQQILWEAEADFHDYLGDFAKDLNRRQPRGGFVNMSMKFEGQQGSRPFAIREDLLRDLECDACARSYAVYAIALFCPDCGAPNLALHFQRETELVREQIALANEQEKAGRCELAYRLTGNAHEDVLTAFETALKTIYRHLVRGKLPERAGELCGKREIGNSFQNIERGQEKFAALGVDPFAALDGEELERLRINIQKRHVIGHNLGIADEHYAELTQSEDLGETVTLIGDEIVRFADICLKVVTGLESQLVTMGQSE
jgi:hypothetical protein